MITKLDNQNIVVAGKLHSIWQRSYPIEAKLVGVVRFPPLEREVFDFQKSTTTFIGIEQEGKLLAALEFDIKEDILDIHSLVVDPEYLRKGYGKKLMEYVLEELDWSHAKVETASANIPAIRLYEKLGFTIYEEYSAEMNIIKVKMKKKQ